MAGGAPVRPDHVLIIVQNLPVPLDRRVWLECRALKAAGYDVSVICPKGPGDPGYQVIDGIPIHKYRPAPEATGLVGFVFEFVYSWLRTAVLSAKVWRRSRSRSCRPATRRTPTGCSLGSGSCGGSPSSSTSTTSTPSSSSPASGSRRAA